MGKFSLFKKMVPAALALSSLESNGQLLRTVCTSQDNNFGLLYDNVDFSEGDKDAFFDYTRINGINFSGGNGTMHGRGSVLNGKLDFELSWTYTGHHDSKRVARLIGAKDSFSGRWNLTLIPWNSESKKYDESKASKLINCQSKSL